jgi:integrase
VIETKPPAFCPRCQDARAAWSNPRVDYCYSCLPGGPFPAPACTGCGSDRYWSDGLCDACHPRGPRHVESCLGCHAWGVTRHYRSRCWTCRWWKTHYREGSCKSCRCRSFISETRVCRLCWETARIGLQPGRPIDVIGANRGGQQLFFANLQSSRTNPHRHIAYPAMIGTPRLSRVPAGQRFAPLNWHQLALFDLPVRTDALKARAAISNDHPLVRFCDDAIRNHAAVHGWTRKLTNDVRRTIRLVAASQHTPGALINATDVARLPRSHGNISATSTIEVLASIGLLNDDRTTPERRYFVDRMAGLPTQMREELDVWFDVMVNGSTTSPRRKPRDPATARLHIRALAPVLRIWASQDHDTLASIERHHIIAVLPPGGAQRHTIEQGLRSLFRILKARRLVFIDPIATLPAAPTNSTIPLPLDTTIVREALDSPRPATALCAALVVFHGLTVNELCTLKLIDIIDGQLHIGARIIPLARPVLPRLAGWLDYRARKWPETINPHLLVSLKTGPRLTSVSRSFPNGQSGIALQALREDRILDEVRATGGDLRHICELFGITIDTAMRYTNTLDHIGAPPLNS